MLSKEQIEKILKQENLKALKSLGQNFLIDKTVQDKIIRASELSEKDFVIEIGPGLGTLTEELSKKCKKVVSVEKDKKMARLLNGKYKNVVVLNDDILKLNPDDFIEKYSNNGKYKIISNIPYYITSPIIKLFLENKVQPKLIVMLVQKEVAQRICSKPGKLSIIALSVQIYGQPSIIDYVDKSSFYPQPKVDSAILKIENIKRDFTQDYYKNIFRIIKIGFSSKRKKLSNNLSAGLCIDKKISEQILSKANINYNARAQDISLEQWSDLSKLL